MVANTGGGGSITEYAPGARGNAGPVVTISGSATGLSNPNGVAFDAAGDLFVTNVGNDSVTEYAPGAERRRVAGRDAPGQLHGAQHPGRDRL